MKVEEMGLPVEEVGTVNSRLKKVEVSTNKYKIELLASDYEVFSLGKEEEIYLYNGKFLLKGGGWVTNDESAQNLLNRFVEHYGCKSYKKI
ncbi:hypothetical protein [Wolinella succinogenes]|uniref:hypothetical protein n=1 Tax=Wolinella succinogenes TaxID=844 RepID=UPI002FC8C389